MLYWGGSTSLLAALRIPPPLYRRESFRGMFKGLNAYMLHIVPNIMIVFGIYEAVLNIHAEMRLEQDLASAEE